MYLTGTTFLRITQTSQSQPENILQHKGLTRRTSRRFIFRALENPFILQDFGVSIKAPTKMSSVLRSLSDSALGRGPSGRQVGLPEAFLCTRQLHLKHQKPCKNKTPNINKINNNYRRLVDTSASTG